jgi:hypothetical protein
MIDKNTILTTIFTIVDDVTKDPKIVKLLTRPGIEPKMSDSEIVSMSVYQELIGEPREDHFYRLHGNSLRKYFPNLVERSRYNRRKRDLWAVILSVRISLLLMLRAHEYDIALIDSAPVPCISYKRDKRSAKFQGAGYGVCTSKAMKYFGYKLHSLVTLTGIIIDFVLTSASPYDNQPVMELLELHQGTLRKILGDKAYNDKKLQEELKNQLGILLWAPRKINQKPTESRETTKANNKIRLMIETVNAQLQEQFHLTKHYAKSQWGLITRIAAKITAHTIGLLINKLYGRSPLALASLAV